MLIKKNIVFILFLLNSINISSGDEFPPIPIPPRFPTVIYEDISLFYIGKDISTYHFSRRFLIMVNNSTLLPFFEVYFDGTYYTIAFDDNNLVNAIFIRETNIYNHQQSFRTSNGVYLGMTYKDLKNIEPNIVLNKMSGWGYFGELKSGWKVAFFIGNTMTEHFPKEDDKIGAIYKD